ncbi:penicillin-binding protein 2 [Sporolactobacillus sp. THM7-7]|nr:penicillin-binding protein 2 [Sporolactobacillus sp. THM7-7]
MGIVYEGEIRLAKETVKNKKTKNNLPLRLNFLFLAVFLAFSILIARLGYVQIVDGEYYKNQVKGSHSQTAKIDSARGKIVDVNGAVMAENNGESAVVYIRHLGIDGYKSLEIARKLSRLITMDDKALKKITQRDEKEYYVLTQYQKLSKAYNDYLSKKEQDALEDKPSREYALLLERIPNRNLPQFSDKDRQVMAILHELNQASNLSPHIIKKGLTREELARVGESLDEFYGTIRTDVASDRVYSKDKPFFLGKMGDIPVEEIDSYLAEGYSRNEQVGISYLEKQYESYLRGIPTTLTFKTRNSVPVGNPTITAGRRGYDVQLTTDMRLQKEVGKILEQNIRSARAIAGNGQNNGAYAVAMNPKTGAILAMGGKTYDPSTGKFSDTSSNTINAQFQIGSAVKGATELVGFQHNAVPSVFTDMPINYKGGGQFKSWEQSGLGTLTPETALEHSSNVFMAKIASNMAGISLAPAGGHYNARGNVGERFRQAFLNLREGYSQFGLGTKTGIDLPSEGNGYYGPMPETFGLIHQFAIGQYDLYTPLQMVQYISTIANGGYRMQPHLLQSVHKPGTDPNKLGPAIYTFKPKVLNTISNNKEDIQRVQKGLYLVTHSPGGTASTVGTGANAKYKIVGKTGTAQIDRNDLGLYNETFVSYAPYDNPEIAVAVVVPAVRSGDQNRQIAVDIYKAYDKLYHYTDRNR